MAGARRSFQYDLVGYNDSGRPTVLVEVKRRVGMSEAWARQLRRNMFEGEPLPEGELFVLVLPDHLYLWEAGAPLDALPTHSFDARPLLAPYFERVGASPEQIAPSTFETLVLWWLSDLTQGTSPSGSHLALASSGLLQALAGGEVKAQVAA